MTPTKSQVLKIPPSPKVLVEQALARLCADRDVSLEFVLQVAQRMIVLSTEVDTAGYTE